MHVASGQATNHCIKTRRVTKTKCIKVNNAIIITVSERVLYSVSYQVNH